MENLEVSKIELIPSQEFATQSSCTNIPRTHTHEKKS